ncbi:hypothetical protein Hanom_Chr06g00495121 [Helianthus anomalus]
MNKLSLENTQKKPFKTKLFKNWFLNHTGLDSNMIQPVEMSCTRRFDRID